MSLAVDDVDEEDIVFDQTTLLTQRVKRVNHGPQFTRCHRVVQTLLLCAAFFGLGLCIAMPGPTLIDLQNLLHTNTSEISQIFTGRSIGYLLGSVTGGMLYDRINQNCLLSFSLILTAVGTTLAPWSKSLTVLVGCIALQGVSMGFLDTGGNVFCLTLWGRSSPPYMQALHFSFGLGAFVAPLIAEPFLAEPYLAEKNITTDINMTLDGKLNRSARAVQQMILAEPMHQQQTGKDSWKWNNMERDKRDADPPKPTAKKKPTTNGASLSKEGADGRKMAGELKKLPPVQNPTESDKASAAPSSPKSTTVKTTKPTTTTQKTTTTKATTTSTKPPTTTTKASIVREPTPDNSTNKTNKTELMDMASTNQTNPISTMIKHIQVVMNSLSRVEFAYLTISLYLLVLSFAFMIMCCVSRQGISAIRSNEVQPDYMIKQETQGFRVQILTLLFFFYFLYVGMEATYGGLIMSFSVTYIGWSKAKGTLLTSLFWGSFALGRGIAIFAGMCMSPALMLISDLVMTCLALAGLVMALDSNTMVLWFCTAVLGAGMASIFPTGITWAERYMLVTGKATSVLVVGSALGEMIMPAMTGYLFETKGPMWLLYVMLGAGLLAAILYIIMQNLASNKGERYEKLAQWLRTGMSDSGNEDIELEMDSLASNSTTNLLEIVSPSSPSTSSSTASTNGKKKVSFNLPKDMNPKNISLKYRPSFMGKFSSKED